MRSIVKQSQRRLRRVQESDRYWQLCRSRAKVKPGGVEEELGEDVGIEIDSQRGGQQDSLGANILYRYQGIADGLQEYNQHPEDYLPGDTPFYYQQLGFMSYLQMQLQQLHKASKSITQLEAQIAQLAHSITTSTNLSDPQNIHMQFDIATKKNQSLLQFIATAIKVDDLKLKKLEEEGVEIVNKLGDVLGEENVMYEEMRGLQNRVEIKQSQFQQKFIVWQRVKNNLLLNKFQTSIIKLQKGCTLYLYGAKVIKSEVSRNQYFDKRCYKFDYRVKPIDMMDLKVFVLTTLFPLSMRIFEDFSSSSNIYKVMFGLQQLLCQQQIDPSCVTLNKRIEKHLVQKKYNSMQQCLNMTVKLRKKMIIFIGTKQSFQQLTYQLINQLTDFRSRFMSIRKASLHQVSSSYEGTSFTHYHMQIQFSYGNISMKSVIELLFCVPYIVSRVEVEEMKRKSGRTDSVLVWFEIPKADYDLERMQAYKEINFILTNSQKFYIPPAKKFNTKILK